MIVVANRAIYGDGRPFDLPDHWEAVHTEVLDTAVAQARKALNGDCATDRVAPCFDRNSSYCGTLFLDIEPNAPDLIEPSDLYAVTTLSMDLDPRHGRLLLGRGEVREGVRRELRAISPSLPIQYLDVAPEGSVETLLRMWELHSRLSHLLGDTSTWWVFAAKLAARKRPYLFPVRDNLVAQYLAGGRPLRRNDGWPGDFSVDIQVYGYLMTHPAVRADLTALANSLAERKVQAEHIDLRLLDIALWMAAVGAHRTPSSESDPQPELPAS